CTASYTLTEPDVDAGSVSNTATANGTPPQGSNVTASDTATVTLPAAPSLNLTKTPTLHQDVVAPNNRVDPGDTISYAFTVTNTGNVTLTGVTLTDPLTSLNCLVGTLAPGQSNSTCIATYTLTQGDVDSGSVSNTATANGTPPHGANTTAQATASVTLPAAPSLSLVKTGTLDETVVAPANRADAGDKVNYSFTVTNTGNVTLTGVTLTDPLTGLNSLAGTLVPGQSNGSCSASHTLTQADVDAGSISNTATATGTPPHGSNVSAGDTATVPLPQVVTIKLTKSGSLDDTV